MFKFNLYFKIFSCSILVLDIIFFIYFLTKSIFVLLAISIFNNLFFILSLIIISLNLIYIVYLSILHFKNKSNKNKRLKKIN